MWFNNICDLECNTSYCNYDFGECLNNRNNITQYCYKYNNSYNNASTIINDTDNNNTNDIDTTWTYYDYINNNVEFDGSCEISWLNDQFCDSFCFANNYQNFQCIDEQEDCRSCEHTSNQAFFTSCYRLYCILIESSSGANDQEPDLVDMSEFCDNWSYIKETETKFDDMNCTQGYHVFDINNDDK